MIANVSYLFKKYMLLTNKKDFEKEQHGIQQSMIQKYVKIVLVQILYRILFLIVNQIFVCKDPEFFFKLVVQIVMLGIDIIFIKLNSVHGSKNIFPLILFFILVVGAHCFGIYRYKVQIITLQRTSQRAFVQGLFCGSVLAQISIILKNTLLQTVFQIIIYVFTLIQFEIEIYDWFDYVITSAILIFAITFQTKELFLDLVKSKNQTELQQKELSKMFNEHSESVIIVNQQGNILYYNQTFIKFLKKHTQLVKDNFTLNTEAIFKFFSLVQNIELIPKEFDEKYLERKETKPEIFWNSGSNMDSGNNIFQLFLDEMSYQFSKNTSFINFKALLNSNNSQLKIQIKIKYSYYKLNKSVQIVVNDLSQAERFFQLEEMNQLKNRLLSSVSHELKTQLNNIMINTQLAIEDPITPSKISSEYLQQCQLNSNILLQYVNNLLDYSLLSSSPIQIQSEKVTFQDIMSNIQSISEKYLQQKGIKFMVTLSDDIPRQFLSSFSRLIQVINNTIYLAQKDLQTNDIVKMNIDYIEDPNDFLKFSIETESAQNLSNLQLDKQLLRKVKTLEQVNISVEYLLTQELIKVLNNDNDYNEIIVSNSNNLCISFQIKIERGDFDWNPYSQEMDKDIQSEEQLINKVKSEVPRYPMTKLQNIISSKSYLFKKFSQKSILDPQLSLIRCTCRRAMIVDDNLFNIKSLKICLKKKQYEIVECVSGPIAITKIKNQNQEKCCDTCILFNIIFMDYDMPEMNGDETTQIIRNLEKNRDIQPYKRLNIILCTANVVTNLNKDLFQQNLPKPINMAQLEKILTNKK